MKTCKDCIHYDVCFIVKEGNEDRNLKNSPCKYFKDKSLVLDLLCKLGELIYVPVISEDGEFESYVDICPVTDISATRIFVSMTSPPGDDFGDYYYISDIGKTFFLTPEAADQALKEREQG